MYEARKPLHVRLAVLLHATFIVPLSDGRGRLRRRVGGLCRGCSKKHDAQDPDQGAKTMNILHSMLLFNSIAAIGMHHKRAYPRQDRTVITQQLSMRAFGNMAKCQRGPDRAAGSVQREPVVRGCTQKVALVSPTPAWGDA